MHLPFRQGRATGRRPPSDSGSPAESGSGSDQPSHPARLESAPPSPPSWRRSWRPASRPTHLGHSTHSVGHIFLDSWAPRAYTLEVRKSQGETAFLVLSVMLVCSIWYCLLSGDEASIGRMLDGPDERANGPAGLGRAGRVRTGPDGSGRVDGSTDGSGRTNGWTDGRTG